MLTAYWTLAIRSANRSRVVQRIPLLSACVSLPAQKAWKWSIGRELSTSSSSTTSSISAASTDDAAAEEQVFSLSERAQHLAVRLTPEELSLLAQHSGANQDLRVTRHKFLVFSRRKWELEVEREAFLAAVEEPAAEKGTLGRWLLPGIGFLGTASYAIAGTQVAGEAGMNVIGCCLVGIISSLGGGSVNALLFGYAKNGVPWARDAGKSNNNLFIALGSSLIAFFLWPRFCSSMAEERLRSIQDMAKARSWWTAALHRVGLAQPTEGISKAEFLAACASASFEKQIRQALAPVLRAQLPGVEPTPDQLFSLIDVNGDGILDMSELEKLVLLEYHGSAMRYAVDTVALGASAVNGPAMALSRGLHPVVCAVSGVTICFGGILRDIICSRDVALGGQAFAFATAAGASVYVALREACVRGVPLPLPLRVALSAGTTVAIRIMDFYADGMLLPPMHGRRKPLHGPLPGDEAADSNSPPPTLTSGPSGMPPNVL